MNGTQMTLEQLNPKTFRNQIVGVLGHRAKTSALPEKEQDCQEIEAVLYRKFLECWKKGKKKIDLNGLSTKTLRECFLRTEDLTTCQSSLKWTDWGTILNGKISTQSGLSHKTGSAYILWDILEEQVDEKYFLSEAATKRLMNYRDKQQIPLQQGQGKQTQPEHMLLEVNSMHKL